MRSAARTFPGRDHRYDVVVVGAGLTGTEAALGCAAAGLDTLLVTTSLDTLYTLFDKTKLDESQLEVLNSPTLLHDLNAELADEHGFVDPWALHRGGKYTLEHTPGVHLLQSSVSTLIVTASAVEGVTTWEGVPRRGRRTALCVGSFLEARLRVGSLVDTAGRLSEMAYDDLYEDLCAHGLGFAAAQREVEGPLPYSVAFQTFASSERTGFRLNRLEHLYAAGLCADPPLTYEQSAVQGRELAAALIADLRG
ncbi:FAD-dependent oxidoreductase [soil metagenome]